MQTKVAQGQVQDRERSSMQKCDRRCIARDSMIHEMFISGVSFPKMAERINVPGVTAQTLQRYVSQVRKIDVTRWPYRRSPKLKGRVEG